MLPAYAYDLYIVMFRSRSSSNNLTSVSSNEISFKKSEIGEEYDTSLHLLGRLSDLVRKQRKHCGERFLVPSKVRQQHTLEVC